jgi:hypothetical protein
VHWRSQPPHGGSGSWLTGHLGGGFLGSSPAQWAPTHSRRFTLCPSTRVNVTATRTRTKTEAGVNTTIFEDDDIFNVFFWVFLNNSLIKF